MELLEIRNNLVKLSYEKDEIPVLGHFITLNSDTKSYVAQFVNLKSDMNGSFAIAKLLFIFSNDGIVDAYDGSVPTLDYGITPLATSELLNLLPVQTPLKFGNLSAQGDSLFLDVSVFEHNFSVFAEHDFERKTVVSNFVRQLFQMKQKSVIVDVDGTFKDFSALHLGKDFKLPLNEKMLKFIFEYELAGVDNATRAVVQDIFYSVEQYIKTLECGFLPIDKFIDVVAQQYKVLQMPELALLKNKLLKYSDANVFADTKEEIDALKAKIQERNTVVVNLKDLNGEFQKVIISYIHGILDSLNDYVCFFVPLDDDNSDKELLRRIINHRHVLSVILVNHSYKYADEVKDYSENVMFFAPKTVQHDFASYNTFLNKLNTGECIVYGKLTLGVPFIIDIEDMELDLTEEDVFGDKYDFVPETPLEIPSAASPDVVQENPITEKDNTETSQDSVIKVVSKGVTDNYELNNIEETDIIDADEDVTENQLNQNSQSEESVFEDFEEESVDDFDDKPIQVFDDVSIDNEDDELSFMEEPQNPETINSDMDFNDLTMDTDIEISDTYNSDALIEDKSQMVPIYPIEEDGYDSMSDDIYAEDAESEYAKGDVVVHPRYGNGVVEKIIKYGNKTLCSINFENVGRRLLDPSISEFSRA